MMRRLRRVSTAEPVLLSLLLVAAAGFYLVFILRTGFHLHGQVYFTLIDDAMVSMRYAHHLAQGQGLVWNLGENPVEGFTNPAWTLFMALVHTLPLPVSKTSLAVMIASALILLANIAVVHRICRVLNPRATFASWIAAGITAFYFPLIFWPLRGMEVGLLVLLIDLAILVAIGLRRDSRITGVVLLGAILLATLIVRLDSILQVSIVVLYVGTVRKLRLSRTGLLIAIVVVTLFGILYLQRTYFGDALPNTYYQKMAGTSAWIRIRNGLLMFLQHALRDTLVMALFVAGGVLISKAIRTREAVFLAALFLVQCAYSVWVGGDYAEPEVDAANRFITQGMPALIILFSLAADSVFSVALAKQSRLSGGGRGLQAAISIGAIVAVLLVISGKPWLAWANDNAPLLRADIRRVKAGVAIAQNTSPDVVIASHAAGQIPYYSDRKTIDLLGLNDPVIAKGPLAGPFYPGHDKWNYAYSIGQLRPDLIADNWIRLGDYMRGNPAYQQLGNGMYVRRDSTLVNVAGLLKSYP